MTDDRLTAIEAEVAAATPGPWQWVDPDSDLPCLPDEPCMSGLHDDVAYRLSLRTVEHFPASSMGPLPKFIIFVAEEFYESTMDNGTVAHPDAIFIAHAPETICYLLKRLRAAEAVCEGAQRWISETGIVHVNTMNGRRDTLIALADWNRSKEVGDG